MFRSALAAALRHLYRGKVHAGIAVFGLAVGLCTALLAALYIRSQYSYDHFIPGYRDVYLTTVITTPMSGRPSQRLPETPAQVAGYMRERFAQVVSVTRLAQQNVRLHVGNVEVPTSIYSVDPNFHETFPFVAIAGSVAGALTKPDQLVLSREDARKLFGDDPTLGRTLEIQLQDGGRHTVTVGALIEDIPRHGTQLKSRIFISGLTSWTRLAAMDQRQGPVRSLTTEVLTLARLHSGASPLSMHMDLKQVLPHMIEKIKQQGPPDTDDWPEDEDVPGLNLLRIDRVHTSPDMNPGINNRIAMAAALGLIVLAIACVNFINLLTARTSARALEVGVRKLAGARRTTLSVQFMGEAFAQVAIAVLVAAALTELLLPHVNAFLEANAVFDYWKEPVLLGWVLLVAIALGLLAGFWPAMVLSALRPIDAMRGARLARGRGGLLRQALVTLQFGLLTGLIVAVGVVHLQHHYATELALRFDTDQMLILETHCTPARLAELRKLAGVRGAACSDWQLVGDGWGSSEAKTRDGRQISINLAWVDDQVLALFGVKPLAGRTLTASDFDLISGRDSTRFLINETAMRVLGFNSPAAALGPYPLMNGLEEIVGVLPDFSMGPVEMRIQPTVFYADPGNFSRIYLKLKGAEIAPTLHAIDKIWNATGGTGWLNRYFYDERVQRMYQWMLRDARAFGIIALVAIVLACLGLLGLAAAVAEQRTKEVGIRKSLGANTADVLRLLLWQFGKPVVWANLLAWPIAGWLMQRWLNSFAYHVSLPLWLFPATALATVFIALTTVSAHALRVARAKPVTALRYE
jgi:putative ABC transport system permease protein